MEGSHFFIWVTMDDLENRFTPPTNFCPHPEYWHSPDSEATELEVTALLGALVRAIQPEFVVETGTYHGHTALAIGNALVENGHGKLVTIESDGANHERAKGALSYLPTVEFILGNSMSYVPEANIDFAFFDSHQQQRANEFLRYHGLGFIKPGAIVAFHDTAPHHQVYQYVKDLLIDTEYIQHIQFMTPRGFLLAQVIK